MQLTPEMLSSIPFQYANDVRSGKIVTGRRIQQAVDRFFTWIDESDSEGYWIDHLKGVHIIWFFENCLIHTKGKSAGKPFLLSPWQQFTLYNVFGWQTLNEEGESVRRIKNVYEKIGKKNGKTAVMAGAGLYVKGFDEEMGAEVYIGATKEEQAKLCFTQAKEFIEKSRILKSLGYRVLQRELQFPKTNSFLKPLGGDSKTQDGINSHFTIIDEYHAHRDDSVKENLESSSAARKQSITYTITTAGTNVHGVCKMFEDSCINILEGVSKDDTFFIMIHDLDKDDDWELPENWVKANPNLGVTVSMDFLLKEYNKAKNQPSKIPNFKTKHLNMWVDGLSEWIASEIWDKGNTPLKLANFPLLGSTGGLDLSTTTDLTAFAVISEADSEGYRDLKLWFFCPKDTIEKRSKEDKVPYKYWSETLRPDAVDENDTWLIATPGNIVDYDIVEKVVTKNYYELKNKWIEYDRKFSGGLVHNFLKTGIELSPFTQTIMNYSQPTKEFERLVLGGKIRHEGNPVLKWMLSGCVPISDTNENIRLDKGRSTKRIDGIIASIMALAGSMTKEETNESKYNNPDVEIII